MSVLNDLADRVRQQEAELDRLKEQLRSWEEVFSKTPAREVLLGGSSGIDVEPLWRDPLKRDQSGC